MDKVLEPTYIFISLFQRNDIQSGRTFWQKDWMHYRCRKSLFSGSFLMMLQRIEGTPHTFFSCWTRLCILQRWRWKLLSVGHLKVSRDQALHWEQESVAHYWGHCQTRLLWPPRRDPPTWSSSLVVIPSRVSAQPSGLHSYSSKN